MQQQPPPVVSESNIPEVFVLWHPRCEIGQRMASSIYNWLRPGQGLGPEVFYRCHPAPDAHSGGLPLPLPGDTPQGAAGQAVATQSAVAQAEIPVNRRPVNLQIVIILLDDHMVSDYTWRHWLAALARSNPSVRRALFPVALDSTAFNAPGPLNERNYLRPVGVPLTDPPGPAREKALAGAIRSLLKQLTEALCRLLLAPLPEDVTSETGSAGSAAKIAIFLSHAKQDGMTPARRIRDFIYANTQLAAFYDENDIPFGSAFSRVLDASIDSASTAALIAVQSKEYAGRPWCRRELSIFRRPRKEKGANKDFEQWKLHPIVVVNALESGAQTTSIPEIGNATQIRWSTDPIEQEEQIVTIVLRDALLAEFHAALGRSLGANAQQIVINWLPDPTTLLHIPRVRERDWRTPPDEALERAESGQAAVEVLYPGRGLAGLELEILDELFPHVAFHSFDQFSPDSPSSDRKSKYRSRSSTRGLIGFSISFESKPLLARGLGLEHLKELLVRLARPILRSGADLAFAGSWTDREDNFTYDLLKLVSAEQEANSVAGPDTDVPIGRLRNHLAWPQYLEVTPRMEAQWIQCSRIIRITQEMAGIELAAIVPDDEPRGTERYLLNSAIVISHLRRVAVLGTSVPIPGTAESYTVPALTARIVLGGKTKDFSGFLPGIFEEALLTLESGRPLYILGGFGGAGESLANFLLNKAAPELEVSWQESASPRVKTLRTLSDSRPLPNGIRSTADSLSALRERLVLARPALAATLNTGLDDAETRDLLTTCDMGRAVQLVLKGLTQSVKLDLRRT
jgi:hypothetical protein